MLIFNNNNNNISISTNNNNNDNDKNSSIDINTSTSCTQLNRGNVSHGYNYDRFSCPARKTGFRILDFRFDFKKNEELNPKSRLV